MNQETSTPSRISTWIGKSISIKLITITILMLLLLIPNSMIKSIIYERQNLNDNATYEVNQTWAGSQTINGPILTIPFEYEYVIKAKKKDEADQIKRGTEYFHILPENLQINGEVAPKTLKRGIYEVVVYTSSLTVNGQFDLTAKPEWSNVVAINYDEAFLTIGIDDLRGIQDQVDFKWGKSNLDVKPGSKISETIYSGITVDLPDLASSVSAPVDFVFDLNLQGSRNMSFVPLGKVTKVDIQSPWSSPSFLGAFLPDERSLSKDGFNAQWKILELNRNFSQSWIGNAQSEKLGSAAFGLDLILPMDDYQKSMRSVKYAAMTIALTFLVFFLVEVLNKRKIHPFQYALVGLALCLFYVLLVSISEHLDFNLAYLISSAGVILMISLYSLSVFRKKRLTLLLVGIMASIYGFLFVTLQLSDYALLMGSIGLSLILGLTMYFTRNIDWYKHQMEAE